MCRLGGIDEEHKRVLDTIRQEEEQKVANAVEERLTAEMVVASNIVMETRKF